MPCTVMRRPIEVLVGGNDGEAGVGGSGGTGLKDPVPAKLSGPLCSEDGGGPRGEHKDGL